MKVAVGDPESGKASAIDVKVAVGNPESGKASVTDEVMVSEKSFGLGVMVHETVAEGGCFLCHLAWYWWQCRSRV